MRIERSSMMDGCTALQCPVLLLGARFHRFFGAGSPGMRSDTNRRIMNFAVIEILLQIGFENVTEQSLAILTDIFVFYAESLIRRILPLGSAPSSHIIRRLLEEVYSEDQYECAELRQFADQQTLSKQHIKDDEDKNAPESLLHALRILPKGAALTSKFKNTKNVLLVEGKECAQISDVVETDEFFKHFVAGAAQQPSQRVVEEYEDCILQTMATLREKPEGKETQVQGFNTDCYLLADNEISLRKLPTNQRYYVFKS